MVFIEYFNGTLFFYSSIALVLQAFFSHFCAPVIFRNILEVSVNIYYTSLVQKHVAFVREGKTGM